MLFEAFLKVIIFIGKYIQSLIGNKISFGHFFERYSSVKNRCNFRGHSINRNN